MKNRRKKSDSELMEAYLFLKKGEKKQLKLLKIQF